MIYFRSIVSWGEHSRNSCKKKENKEKFGKKSRINNLLCLRRTFGKKAIEKGIKTGVWEQQEISLLYKEKDYWVSRFLNGDRRLRRHQRKWKKKKKKEKKTGRAWEKKGLLGAGGSPCALFAVG